MDLKNKNIIYIGGFGGIGQKCVEEILKNDIRNLVIFDLLQNDEYLSYLQETYENQNIYYETMDMTQTKSIEEAYKRAVNKIKHIDVVINGSGILDERLINSTIATNLTGVIHSNLIALNYMNKSKGGHGGLIVNVSSVAGIEPYPTACVYAATKFGIIGFTRSLGCPLYLEKTGVRFITICPGLTVTPILNNFLEKVSFPEFGEELTEHLTKNKHASQTPAEYSKAFVKILEEAENGTAWVVDNGQYEKIDFPTIWTPVIEELQSEEV